MLCDLAIAADDARLGEPEIRFSNGPPCLIMPWIIGMRAAKELLYTGKMIDAQRALQLGMVNEVCAPRRSRAPRPLPRAPHLQGLTAGGAAAEARPERRVRGAGPPARARLGRHDDRADRRVGDRGDAHLQRHPRASRGCAPPSTGATSSSARSRSWPRRRPSPARPRPARRRGRSPAITLGDGGADLDDVGDRVAGRVPRPLELRRHEADRRDPVELHAGRELGDERQVLRRDVGAHVLP